MIYFSDSKFSNNFNSKKLEVNIILLERERERERERHLRLKNAPVRAKYNTNFLINKQMLSYFKIAFLGLYYTLSKPRKFSQKKASGAFLFISVLTEFTTFQIPSLRVGTTKQSYS